MATCADLSIVRQAEPQQQQSLASPVSPPQSPTSANTTPDPDAQCESYDVARFVGDVPEELRCGVCQRVPREPQITQCCSQLYCLACLRAQDCAFAGKSNGKGGVGKNGAVRPSDMIIVRAKTRTLCCLSERELVYKPDHARQHRIYSLEIKCGNAGCEWSGTIEALQTQHVTSCVHATVHCRDCARETRRGDLENHRTTECRFRPTHCPHCDQEGPYAEIMGLDAALTKKHRCPKVLATCPNRCKGSKRMERGELGQHLSVCPLQTVDCEFKSVGCTAQPLRKSLGLHMKNEQQQHLLLLLNATQTKMSALSSELDLLSKIVKDPATVTSLACMRTQMRLGRLCLDGIGDRVTFRVRNYSHLEQYSQEDGKWESPPFYFISNYRMELIVYPGGLGAFMGRSLSIILQVHKPESHSRSNQDMGWPIDCAYIALKISVLPQLGHSDRSSDPHSDAEQAPTERKSVKAHICHLCRQRHGHPALPEDAQQATAEVLKQDDFVRSQDVRETGLIFQDSIILRVELSSCECVPRE